MSDTTLNQKAVLGQKVQFIEENRSPGGTKVNSDKSSPSISVIYRSKNGVANAGIFYVRVDFNSNKKKETYKKINKILGDR